MENTPQIKKCVHRAEVRFSELHKQDLQTEEFIHSYHSGRFPEDTYQLCRTLLNKKKVPETFFHKLIGIKEEKTYSRQQLMTVYMLLVEKCTMKDDRDSQLTLQDSDTILDDETTHYDVKWLKMTSECATKGIRRVSGVQVNNG